MLINNREWEIQILSGIQHLVHLLIEASYAKGLKKETLLNQAISHLRDLNPSLLKLIDGKEEHLEALIRQLFSQKLPPGFILTSFGGLKRDLDLVIQQALIPSEPEPDPVPEVKEDNEPLPDSKQEDPIDADITTDTNYLTAEPVGDMAADSQEPPRAADTGPSLADIITNFYPGEKVIHNYFFRSISIDYYLPDRKIAFVLLSPHKRIYKLHHLLLKKEGIILIEVNPRELNNIRLLARHLPKF